MYRDSGVFSSREISVVSKGLGDAERVIDPTGLVVASGGIIDRHAHGRLIPVYRMQVFDGVTTTLISWRVGPLMQMTGRYLILCQPLPVHRADISTFPGDKAQPAIA